jgi:hypothetical protein
VLVVSLLLGLSPLAADSTIRRGTDVFTTTSDGSTYYDFAQSPIPAGFFCKGSKAFTGRVAFKGLPLVTGAPGQLGGADTVIERLDDADFDANGTAATRIQFRALSMVSIAPIKTACGAFHLYVSLGGKQRVTTMNIYRTQQGGGNFLAPLAVNVRMTFIPVKPATNKGARSLELTGGFTFPASPLPWSFTETTRAQKVGPVVVDTDGNLIPDTLLPPDSNFSPGSSPERLNQNKVLAYCSCIERPTCHTDPATGKFHCVSYIPPGCEGGGIPYCPDV